MGDQGVNDISCQMASALCSSSYFVGASGLRDAGFDELKEIVRILRGRDAAKAVSLLEALFKYHPDTIALNQAAQKHSCTEYDPYNCDCFLPGITAPYCQRKRVAKLKESDYRGTLEYKTWRTSVFERDEFTCQDCGARSGELNAHHIKKFKIYPELRYTLKNGVTLCVLCHRDRHRVINNG